MRIEWSPLAEEAWQDIANYIFDSFGVRALLDYSELTDSWMDLLISNPLVAAFEESLSHRSKHYRSIAIHQFSKIIYYIDFIRILTDDLFKNMFDIIDCVIF